MNKQPKKEAVAKQEHEVEFVPLGANDKIRLSAAMVREFVAVPTKSGKLPSERDCIRFIMLCSGKRANPFEGDVWMLGYDTVNGPSFSIVCGLELFTKRAEQSEFYDGIESGIFLNDASDNFAERQGTLLLPGETLLGGWAKIYRKDRGRPEYKTVNFATYDTGRSRWQKDPAGMIEKVARSQGLRAAYPTPLGGLYIQEEMERLTEAGENMALEPKEPIIMPTAKIDNQDDEQMDPRRIQIADLLMGMDKSEQEAAVELHTISGFKALSDIPEDELDVVIEKAGQAYREWEERRSLTNRLTPSS